MKIQEAIAKMREVVPRPERAVSISLSVWDHSHTPEGQIDIEFSVYAEREIYKAPTLADAVAKFLLNEKAPQGSVAEAEIAVDETEAIRDRAEHAVELAIDSHDSDEIPESDIPF